VETRSATVDDYDAYVALFAALGVDEPVPSRERFAADIVARMLIACDGGEAVGYALLEHLAEVGYVRNLVSSPAHRRRGIGRALMVAMRERFVARGARAWCLNVKPDNLPAIALYRECGLAPVSIVGAASAARGGAAGDAAAAQLEILHMRGPLRA
jgi:ribosomal protein S18 acetylase RimI-like enzyme